MVGGAVRGPPWFAAQGRAAGRRARGRGGDRVARTASGGGAERFLLAVSPGSCCNRTFFQQRAGSRRMTPPFSPPFWPPPPVPDDYAGWKPLWDGYNAFYGREGPTALPDEITQVTWQRFFDAYEPVHALVA